MVTKNKNRNRNRYPRPKKDGNDRYYIQSALNIADPEKKKQEIASLLRIPDSFKKIVVVRDHIGRWLYH